MQWNIDIRVHEIISFFFLPTDQVRRSWWYRFKPRSKIRTAFSDIRSYLRKKKIWWLKQLRSPILPDQIRWSTLLQIGEIRCVWENHEPCAAKLNRPSRYTKQTQIPQTDTLPTSRIQRSPRKLIESKAQRRGNRSRSSATKTDLFDESSPGTRSAWGRWKRSDGRRRDDLITRHPNSTWRWISAQERESKSSRHRRCLRDLKSRCRSRRERILGLGFLGDWRYLRDPNARCRSGREKLGLRVSRGEMFPLFLWRRKEISRDKRK